MYINFKNAMQIGNDPQDSNGPVTLQNRAYKIEKMSSAEPPLSNKKPAKEVYKGSLLAALDELRKKQQMCDVAITIQGQEFAAHRCILTASSNYFRGVFTSETRDKMASKISLDNLDPTVFDSLLGYIYTGEIEITEENACSIVSSADYLLIQSVKDIGCEFLGSVICPENCFELRDFAEKFTCDQLEATATDFIINNFVEASNTDGFKAIDYRVLSDVIGRDDLVVSREEQVYEAIIAWVKHDLKSRRKYFENLFKQLRLVSISKYYLTESVETEELVNQSFPCTKLLLKAMKSYAVYEFEGLEKPRKGLERHVSAIVLCGGNRSRDVICFIPGENKWSSLADTLIARDEHAAVVNENTLYAFGTNAENSLIVEHFNACTNSWSAVSNIPQARCAMAAVASCEQIFVVGGRTQNGSASSNVLRYDPSINKWFFEPPMNSSRAGLCAVALNNFIYAIGGINGDGEFLNTVEKYNPRSKAWSETRCMKTARYYACAAVLDTKIYVMGGQAQNGSCLQTCEVYSLQTDEWASVPSLCVPRQAACITRWKNKLFLFGGCNNSGRLDAVECYDTRANAWSVVAKMPASRSWMQCGVLRLPKQLVNS